MQRNWPCPTSAKELADILVDELLTAGFTIQRYDAYSTNSIYLKLDYGVCNSIRISDHKGKKHLSYRYNIGFDVPAYYTKDATYLRHFFPVKEYRGLINLCIRNKRDKVLKYGEKGYRQFMNYNLENKKDSKGFWSDARIIKRVK